MHRFMKFGPAVLVAVSFALPVQADGPQAPVALQETSAVQQLSLIGSDYDWTGGYVGAAVGYGRVKAGSVKDNGVLYGLRAGYDWEMEGWVLGVGVDHDIADIKLSGGSDKLKSITRLKLRAGADLGKVLVYATAGPARAKARLGGRSSTDTGWFAGVGADYAIDPQWTIGAEILTNQFNKFGGSTTDLTATTASVNVGFRF
ncbi:hypothetical protein DEA8626_01268 [Defluviimonas aquaemixtae]|uniref:Outer membrane protein beta-barrel domain-containing protein n=1 Tax=Albidovulum aquaemixtae TaxID=1542388 RepID=A0A2R8B539_9RHOB|nr:outer membrane beta-barrel protein [Defluviimonas aquaemixtae]SPH17741.1 hypothetical protein DEA8626_01268 [Defluviimonas aquaemixtae]